MTGAVRRRAALLGPRRPGVWRRDDRYAWSIEMHPRSNAQASSREDRASGLFATAQRRTAFTLCTHVTEPGSASARSPWIWPSPYRTAQSPMSRQNRTALTADRATSMPASDQIVSCWIPRRSSAVAAAALTLEPGFSTAYRPAQHIEPSGTTSRARIVRGTSDVPIVSQQLVTVTYANAKVPACRAVASALIPRNGPHAMDPPLPRTRSRPLPTRDLDEGPSDVPSLGLHSCSIGCFWQPYTALNPSGLPHVQPLEMYSTTTV
ncbi:hypothetical protein PsYK624_170860 [Phanerochaete sordida]|uniref:Uncharacterized protein n=1 Tax=Phanerochaete sordida TaxID=48140 RepID=A0A9P3GUM0_9APHY|nr:hypothetical protein PsYK624_170860 [Phanerochaete sordida]